MLYSGGFNHAVLRRLVHTLASDYVFSSQARGSDEPWALYETASRFNHSCMGNAQWVMLRSNMLIYAVCCVKKQGVIVQSFGTVLLDKDLPFKFDWRNYTQSCVLKVAYNHIPNRLPM